MTGQASVVLSMAPSSQPSRAAPDLLPPSTRATKCWAVSAAPPGNTGHLETARWSLKGKGGVREGGGAAAPPPSTMKQNNFVAWPHNPHKKLYLTSCIDTSIAAVTEQDAHRRGCSTHGAWHSPMTTSRPPPPASRPRANHDGAYDYTILSSHVPIPSTSHAQVPTIIESSANLTWDQRDLRRTFSCLALDAWVRKAICVDAGCKKK